MQNFGLEVDAPMDFSDYFKRNNALGPRIQEPEKRCRVCGEGVARGDDPFLYYQKFCSERCKEKYVHFKD
ncbi:MAG: hypothetical protein ABID38_05740 [Candidatus Diapherotrites archaeon]